MNSVESCGYVANHVATLLALLLSLLSEGQVYFRCRITFAIIRSNKRVHVHVHVRTCGLAIPPGPFEMDHQMTADLGLTGRY